MQNNKFVFLENMIGTRYLSCILVFKINQIEYGPTLVVFVNVDWGVRINNFCVHVAVPILGSGL